jgi:nucleoside-diphosphate-sugar epimerase
MKVLALGGTTFLGRAAVEAALALGHDVTVFNRGVTNPELFPEATKLRGDLLAGELEPLRNGVWDAVIDLDPTTLPWAVRRYLELLAPRIGYYVFVSTLSVYADPSRPINETAPVKQLRESEPPKFRDDLYGELKVGCERAVIRAFGERAVIVRPGLIVGPHDPRGRFTYWVRRIAAGGEVVAPAPPNRPVQLVDVRDLAAWLVRLVEDCRAGVFNATGVAGDLTLGRLPDECRAVSGSDARVIWLEESRLAAAKVTPLELPLWFPASHWPLMEVDVSHALAAGLSFRPIAESIRDTLAWDSAREEPLTVGIGLTAERERELLAT